MNYFTNLIQAGNKQTLDKNALTTVNLLQACLPNDDMLSTISNVYSELYCKLAVRLLFEQAGLSIPNYSIK